MAIVASPCDVVIVINWAAVAPTMMVGPRVADVAGAVVPFRPWARGLSYEGLGPLVLRWGSRIPIVIEDRFANLVCRAWRVGVKAVRIVNDSRGGYSVAAGCVGTCLTVRESLGGGHAHNCERAAIECVLVTPPILTFWPTEKRWEAVVLMVTTFPARTVPLLVGVSIDTVFEQ